MVYTTPLGVNYYWDGTPQGAFDVGLEAEANIPPGTTFPSYARRQRSYGI